MFDRNGNMSTRCVACGESGHQSKDCTCPGGGKYERRDVQLRPYQRQKTEAEMDSAKGGKGKKGKGKGNKGNAPPTSDIPWPTTAEERKKVKCAYFQTKFNGGWTCPRGDSCGFDHTECSSLAEYRKLPKPPRLTPPVSPSQSLATSPRNSPRQQNALPTRPKESSESKTPQLCPNGANCKGAPPPVGDGSCKNQHG